MTILKQSLKDVLLLVIAVLLMWQNSEINGWPAFTAFVCGEMLVVLSFPWTFEVLERFGLFLILFMLFGMFGLHFQATPEFHKQLHKITILDGGINYVYVLVLFGTPTLQALCWAAAAWYKKPEDCQMAQGFEA